MVLPAAALRFKNGDSEYRYRPDSELFYLTGWERPDCVAVLRGFADERRFVLFAPDRDEKRELWAGPRQDLDEVRAAFEADEVLPLASLREEAPRLLADGDAIHYRLGASADCDDVALAALRLGRARRARRGAGARALADPGVVLDDMRVRKDAAEIARIREAARITVAAFREALGRVRPGAGEWEVEAALAAGFRTRGADGPAFASIVAAGANACTLHYTANDCRIGSDDMVLVDAGAEFGWYAADVTRTLAAKAASPGGAGSGADRVGEEGAVGGARREAYEVVLSARRAALEACVPGGGVDAVHDAASRAMAEGLVAMGVLDGPADDVLERGDQRAFFPHQTSHWLGLDTHDVGDYESADGPTILGPGMALTVEPGLYFGPGAASASSSGPGAAWARELAGTGIRIEDDVLIGERGAEVLTEALPVEWDAVGALAGR